MEKAQEVRVVHPTERRVEVISGGMTRMEGVSQELGGAQGIHLAFATIPPGGRSSPHRHTNCESAIYVMRGRGRFLVGERLERALEISTGDFIYVPPQAVHAPVNEGDEPLGLIVARNASVEEVEEVSVPGAAGTPS